MSLEGSNPALFYSNEQIRLIILTNACRMLVRRGNLDIKKYSTDTNGSNPFDDSKFLPYIQKKTDDNVYIIPLDFPKTHKYEKDPIAGFDEKTIVIKIIHHVMKDIGTNNYLNDYFKAYNTNHKFIIFDGVSDKVYNVLNKKRNV